MWLGSSSALADARSLRPRGPAESLFAHFSSPGIWAPPLALYLAWRMWSAPVTVRQHGPAPRADSSVRMFLAGLAVTLGNPKIMVFYLALLPTIIDVAGITLLAWLELTGTMLVILAVIDLAYIVLAARARRLLNSSRPAPHRQPHQRNHPRRRRRHAGDAVMGAPQLDVEITARGAICSCCTRFVRPDLV